MCRRKCFYQPYLILRKHFIDLTYCYFIAASLLSAMDPTANPCEDFYQFACGTWDKRHLIPEDKSSINTFEVLADRLQVILKG